MNWENDEINKNTPSCAHDPSESHRTTPRDSPAFSWSHSHNHWFSDYSQPISGSALFCTLRHSSWNLSHPLQIELSFSLFSLSLSSCFLLTWKTVQLTTIRETKKTQKEMWEKESSVFFLIPEDRQDLRSWGGESSWFLMGILCRKRSKRMIVPAETAMAVAKTRPWEVKREDINGRKLVKRNLWRGPVHRGKMKWIELNLITYVGGIFINEMKSKSSGAVSELVSGRTNVYRNIMWKYLINDRRKHLELYGFFLFFFFLLIHLIG